MTRRAALYARVSTADQHTDGQITRLREVAARAGWTIAAEHVEVISGAAKTRPEFDRMMASVRRRKVDVIAAVDLTRLGRTTIGLMHLLDDLRVAGCDLYVDREALDTTTAAGRMMFTFIAAIAAFERELLIERTKDGMAAARARGSQIGRAPAGEGIIAAIRSLRAQGMGMDRIAKTLKCGKGLSQRVCQEFDKEAANA
ncbi:recombinase family protein [Paracoccus sp. SJTW-4]|uniref:recombinase family protein n=1 Tax=Paracoccus sp. SJTW-4 TaxID=3078428 RepID=UPI0039E7F96D